MDEENKSDQTTTDQNVNVPANNIVPSPQAVPEQSWSQPVVDNNSPANIAPMPNAATSPVASAETNQIATPEPMAPVNQETTTSAPSNTAGQMIDPMVNPEIAPEIKYAGFWIRYAASLVDGILLSIVATPIFLIFSASLSGASTDLQSSTEMGGLFMTYVGVCLLISIIFWAYTILMTSHYGYTLGKKVFGLKVVNEETNGLISWKRAALREIVGKFISGLVLDLGFIMAGFDARKQGWHDKIAKTIVIYSK